MHIPVRDDSSDPDYSEDESSDDDDDESEHPEKSEKSDSRRIQKAHYGKVYEVILLCFVVFASH